MVLGAGTVLTARTCGRARDAGAKFGVAPGLNQDVVAEAGAHRASVHARRRSPPPRSSRPSPWARSLLKFFPSEAFGGLKVIKALAAPYGHTGVKFMPTGGVTTANLAGLPCGEGGGVRRRDVDRLPRGHRGKEVAADQGQLQGGRGDRSQDPGVTLPRTP